MTYFENALMRSMMMDANEKPVKHEDNYDFDPCCDPIGFLSSAYYESTAMPLTTRIDVSAANDEIARIRREERERLEAEIREYQDAVEHAEWEEALFVEMVDSQLHDMTKAARRKKNRRVKKHNKNIILLTYNDEHPVVKHMIKCGKRLSEIGHPSVYKKLGRKSPRRNPDLVGKVGNRSYWV